MPLRNNKGLPRFMQPVRALASTPVATGNFDEGGGGPSGATVPNRAMVVQEQTFWCWASVTQAVHRIRNSAWLPQRQIAHEHLTAHKTPIPCSNGAHQTLNQSLCDDSGCTGVCNSQHMLRGVLQERGLLRTRILGAPDKAAILSEIAAGRPVACRVGHSTGGHFVLIVGWSAGTRGMEFIDFLDPAQGVAGGKVPVSHVPFGDVTAGRYNGVTTGNATITHSYEVA